MIASQNWSLYIKKKKKKRKEELERHLKHTYKGTVEMTTYNYEDAVIVLQTRHALTSFILCRPVQNFPAVVLVHTSGWSILTWLRGFSPSSETELCQYSDGHKFISRRWLIRATLSKSLYSTVRHMYGRSRAHKRLAVTYYDWRFCKRPHNGQCSRKVKKSVWSKWHKRPLQNTDGKKSSWKRRPWFWRTFR